MQLLFAITVCCFGAVLWIALALARRIRHSQAGPRRAERRIAAPRIELSRQVTKEFFEAGEFRTPRTLRLEQDILQQRPRLPLAGIGFASASSATASPSRSAASLSASNLSAPGPLRYDAHRTVAGLRRPPAAEPIPIRQAPAFASLFGQNIPIDRIGQSLQTNDTGSPSRPGVSHSVPGASPVPIALHRKPPQVAGLRRRVDLSHYNKDLGDLTDPYTNPMRGSGTQGPVPANRNQG